MSGLAAASGACRTADRTGCLPVAQVAARRLQHVRKGRLDLRWLETHLGFSFATASPAVRAFREPVAGHVVKQAVPLTLIQWVQLEMVAQSSEGPTQLLVSVWLVMLLGLVRFAHLQRSSVTEPGASFSGVASVGKIRVRGVRRPVEWVAS